VRSLLIATAVLVFLVTGAAAEVPQVMGYQGRVVDNLGDPVADNTYTMRFRIYDNSTGSGAPLWDSGDQSVATSGGVFNVMLGESPQPALGLEFDQDYWLLATFEGENQTPLRRLGSTAYAYMASGLVPGTLVEGALSGTFQAAVRCRNLATTGVNFGVSGASYSTAGAGVFGWVDATTGTNYGVYGQSDSPSGYGIYGANSMGRAGGFDGDVDIDGRLELPDNDATPTVGSGAIQIGDASRALRLDGNEVITNTGETLHLQRDNSGYLSVDDGTLFVDGPEGRVGVGTTTPLWGKVHVNASGSLYAVYGENTATSGVHSGIVGRTLSTAGRAVQGWADVSTGEVYGVYGTTGSDEGTAVYGWAYETSGATTGVRGEVASPGPLAVGVFGASTAGSGESYGVYGMTESTDGEGIVGFCAATTGHNNGVYACTFSTNGDGVLGVASATTGLCVGAVGETYSDEGYGVFYIGGIGGSGKMKSFLPAADGHVALGIHATAGDWVEHFGEATLSAGRADVQLDPLFLETVTIDEEHPMKVFVQLHDETCQGVAVKKSETAFSVIELNGGRSDGTFDYRVVARRKGYEDARLEVVRELPATSHAEPPPPRSRQGHAGPGLRTELRPVAGYPRLG
jgi:hypothetical protein